MSRAYVSALLVAGFLALVPGARAEQPAVLGREEALRQEELRRRFDTFQHSLLRLAHRLEASPHAADREKAVALKKALRLASDKAIDAQFSVLAAALHGEKALRDPERLQDWLGKNEDLRRDIRLLIALLLGEDRDTRLRADEGRLLALLSSLREIIARQERLRANTEAGRQESGKLQTEQADLARRTLELARGQEGKVEAHLRSAHAHERRAEGHLGEHRHGPASEAQSDALDELNRARRHVEGHLHQVRHEEHERLLKQLRDRLREMLALQQDVRDGTARLGEAIGGKGPTRLDRQEGFLLADAEGKVVAMADAALTLVEAEGSSVAFAEVLRQVRADMAGVSARLRQTDAGPVTLAIEDDILASLRDMVAALEKRLRQIEEEDDHVHHGPYAWPPPKPPLVDRLAELRMVRSLQAKIHRRTKRYGDQYEGEQVPAPEAAADPKVRRRLETIRRELQDLAGRQKVLHKVAGDLARRPHDTE